MARKFLVPIDFNSLEALQFRLQNLATPPSSPVIGRAYFDTALGAAYVWNGTAWVAVDPSKAAAGSIPNTALTTNPLARANHTGTQTASTISDFATQVQATRLDQLAAPTGPVSANSQKVTSLADPTNPQDAATKNYVDNAVNGTDWKNSVRASTTANIALTGTQTIDGVSVVAGDRVLVKNQTTASQNGIYVVAAGAWSRASDAGVGQITSETSMMVEEGTTNGSTQWRVATTGAITVGTTSLSFTQFGAGSSYSAGTGISIAGNTISVDTSVVPRKFSQTIGDGSSTSIAVTHSLGTQDVQVAIRDASTNAILDTDWAATSASVVTFTFAAAPAANAYRVTIVG